MNMECVCMYIYIYIYIYVYINWWFSDVSRSIRPRHTLKRSMGINKQSVSVYFSLLVWTDKDLRRFGYLAPKTNNINVKNEVHVF